MSWLEIIAYIYVAVLIIIFLYIVCSALFWDRRHDKLIPYYFGVVLELGGWKSLVLQAGSVALLWTPLGIWIGYVNLKMNLEMKKLPKEWRKKP